MKAKKKEDLDLNSLPEVNALLVSLNQIAKDANARRNKDAILKTKRTDYSFISREDIRSFAKDKGLFAPVDEKKKDKQVEGLPKECTPAVFAEAYQQLVDEQLLSKRLEKKEIADAIAAGKPIPTKKKDDKKAPPKDSKKRKEEEEPEEAEDLFPKHYDHVFVLENYPETPEEFEALGKSKAGVGPAHPVRLPRQPRSPLPAQEAVQAPRRPSPRQSRPRGRRHRRSERRSRG